MLLSSHIAKLRMDYGLSQAKLSQLSGVSIAFIQQLEYGNGNPSVKTLSDILKVFNCELTMVPTPVDWDTLAAIGLPITPIKPVALAPNKALVLRLISQCCNEVLFGGQNERNVTALQAWLLAVKHEYPTFFQEQILNPMVEKLMPKQITGQHIKLKRIAVAKIKEYL